MLLGADTCGYDCEVCKHRDNEDACIRYLKESMADHLLANGVTVQKWIPVTERLPEEKGWCWVYAPSYSGGSSSGLCHINGIMFAKWNGKNWSIEVGYHKRPGCVTHWMPLPEPPMDGGAENE